MSGSEYDLLHHWFRVADWCAYDLLKSGEEALVLAPLGAHSGAATLIVRAASGSADYLHRKVSASLAGWIDAPDDRLLRDLLDQERSRDAALPVDDTHRLDCQSVVEDIVFSAARWARHERTRTPALNLLRDLVERTVKGEYWNTAPYAVVTLCRYRAEESAQLLETFREYAAGSPPAHPSNPSLRSEREFAQELLRGNKLTLESIENVLVEKDAALQTDLDEASKTAVQELCSAAAAFALAK